MAYRDPQYDDDDEADLDDRDDPDAADVRDGDEADTVPCPYCGKAVYEEAEVCAHCGSFIVPDNGASRRPWWVVVVAILLLIVILFGWVF